MSELRNAHQNCTLEESGDGDLYCDECGAVYEEAEPGVYVEVTAEGSPS